MAGLRFGTLVLLIAGRRVTTALMASDRIGEQGRLLGTVALLFLVA